MDVKYVWMVTGCQDRPCDIRRYAYSHPQAVDQLKHCQGKYGSYEDKASKGVWRLFKLVPVNKRRG